MARFSRRGTRRSPRRKWAWGVSWWSSAGQVINGGGNANVIELAWVKEPAGRPNNAVDNLEPDDETLSRLMPHAAFWAKHTDDISVQYSGYLAMGIMVFDGLEGATLPGIAEVPWPISDLPGNDEDWVWKWVVPIATLPRFEDTNTGPSQLIDSRAQRKLSSGAGLLLVVQSRAISAGSMAYAWDFYTRVGLKEP